MTVLGRISIEVAAADLSIPVPNAGRIARLNCNETQWPDARAELVAEWSAIETAARHFMGAK